LQGYGDRGGAGQEDAWHLWGKAGLADGFQQAWALSDVDRDGRLDTQARMTLKPAQGAAPPGPRAHALVHVHP